MNVLSHLAVLVQEKANQRNQEVLTACMARVTKNRCNYRKVLARFNDLIRAYPSGDLDYWYELRSVRKHLSYKRPCGVCRECILARIANEQD